MLLCIDIGNTNIKLGLFDVDAMCCHWRIATDRNKLADEYAMLLLDLFKSSGVAPEAVHGCAISSVVPVLTGVFDEFSRRYLNVEPLIQSTDTLNGIEIHTDNPAEVGSDLVMNALGARSLFGAPVVIIGFGTATTFVAVSKQGNLEGVAIAPGLATSGESLFAMTSTLPRIALSKPSAAIGKNTVASIQSGFIYGFVGLVEALVRRFREEIGANAPVVATGGLAEVIAAETEIIDAIEPNLALIGLKLMYEQNNSGESI